MDARRAMLAVALLALVAGGCDSEGRFIGTGSSGPSEVAEPDTLVAQPSSALSDVPMPVGFGLVENKSRSVSAPGVRLVDHQYSGSEDKWSVGRFFKRQMPAHQWTLMADHMYQGDVVLDFSKGREYCVVTISAGSWVWSKTNVRVAIYPTSRAAQ